MSNAYNKRKGASAEIDLVAYFRSVGLEADRLHLAGAKDEGDVLLRMGGEPYTIEVKNTKAMDLSGWLHEAEIQAGHFAQARGIEVPHFLVVHKRRGHTNPANWYTTMPVREWLSQTRPPF